MPKTEEVHPLITSMAVCCVAENGTLRMTDCAPINIAALLYKGEGCYVVQTTLKATYPIRYALSLTPAQGDHARHVQGYLFISDADGTLSANIACFDAAGVPTAATFHFAILGY